LERLKELFAGPNGIKLAALAAFAGLCLLLLPVKGRSANTEELSEQDRLCSLIASIEGVGRTELMLSEQGAVVVCQGADDAAVQLEISRALQCYTGLGADRIRIFLMQSN